MLTSLRYLFTDPDVLFAQQAVVRDRAGHTIADIVESEKLELPAELREQGWTPAKPKTRSFGGDLIRVGFWSMMGENHIHKGDDTFATFDFSKSSHGAAPEIVPLILIGNFSMLGILHELCLANCEPSEVTIDILQMDDDGAPARETQDATALALPSFRDIAQVMQST